MFLVFFQGAIAGGIVGILVVSLTVISLIVCRRRYGYYTHDIDLTEIH
jgi:hypothetical protein